MNYSYKTLGYHFLLLMLTSAAHAAGGGAIAGNGGDICEDRIKIVRDDIASWIGKGGTAGLTLPRSVSLTQYNSGMLAKISAAGVNCTDNKILIGNDEKTCKNFVDSGGAPQIVCNNKRFMETADSDQYVLVHHEYAGTCRF